MIRWQRADATKEDVGNKDKQTGIYFYCSLATCSTVWKTGSVCTSIKNCNTKKIMQKYGLVWFSFFVGFKAKNKLQKIVANFIHTFLNVSLEHIN